MTINTQIAGLQNVLIAKTALDHAINRPVSLPGIVCFYGPSGYGKTVASCHAANKSKSYYIQAKSTWTKKDLAEAILKEIGQEPERKTTTSMIDQIGRELGFSRRPLIIDEFDYLVRDNCINVVRDIYESCQTPMMLIGEEKLEVKLLRFDRFHNRVLEWYAAQPCLVEDARKLCKMYADDIRIDDILLQKMIEATKGCTRRIVNNIERVRQFALQQSLDNIGVSHWGDRSFYNGHVSLRAQ